MKQSSNVPIAEATDDPSERCLEQKHAHTCPYPAGLHPVTQIPLQQHHHDASEPCPRYYALPLHRGHLGYPFRCLGCFDDDPRHGHGHLLAPCRQDWQACARFHCGTCENDRGIPWLLLTFLTSSRIELEWWRHPACFHLPPYGYIGLAPCFLAVLSLCKRFHCLSSLFLLAASLILPTFPNLFRAL